MHDKVAIIGAGPIGMGQLQLAKMSGADVLIVDPVEHSLRVARDLGADRTVNPDQEDPIQAVMEFTGGRGADIAFECAGGESMPETLRHATQMARRGGKVVIVGGFDAGELPITLEWQKLQMSEIQLIPSASYAFWDIYPEMQICLNLMAQGKLKAGPLITHRFPLDQINEAFRTAQDKQNTGAIFVALTL